MSSDLEFAPAEAGRWDDLARLFGERGACGGCWCMWWRLPKAEFDAGKGAGNRAAHERIVGAGEVPGILAYAGGEPVGWCAVAPRQAYVRLAKSRALKALDDQPVWSVTCLFVRKDWRRKGLTVRLLQAAADHVHRAGGEILEGYPVEPRKGAMPDAFAYTGVASAFLKAGFRPAGRGPTGRLIVRRPARTP